MSTKSSTVAHWTEKEPNTLVAGVLEYTLFAAAETHEKRIFARLIVIEPGATYNPAEFHGEIVYHILAGNGILVWGKYHTEIPVLLENDLSGWVPGTLSHRMENTGEGPIRCLVVSCETTEGNYDSLDGSVAKLDTLTPTRRRIDDDVYAFKIDTDNAKKLCGAVYQVFSPGKKQGMHHHDEEVIYVVRGKGKLISGGTEFAIEAGTAANNPHDITHQLINTGTDKFGYIVLEFAR